MRKFAGGTSVLFVGSAPSGKSIRIRILEELAREHGFETEVLDSISRKSHQRSPKVMCFNDIRNSANVFDLISRLCANNNQFILSTYPTFLSDYQELIKKHHIEVINLHHIPYQERSLVAEEAKQWAKSWVLYRSPESTLEEIATHVHVNHDLFQFLSVTKPAHLEKIISLYLMSPTGLVEQNGFVGSASEAWLKNYAAKVVGEISYHLIPVVAQLVLHFL